MSLPAFNEQNAEDVDYFTTFQRLAHVSRRIREHGPSTRDFLARSNLYHTLGDHVRSCKDAVRLLFLEPESPEGHYRFASACLALASQRLGLLPRAPGATSVGHEGPHEDPLEYLQKAVDSFKRAYLANPRDREALGGLHAAGRLYTRVLHRKSRWDR